jgi:hypothetical protein
MSAVPETPASSDTGKPWLCHSLVTAGVFDYPQKWQNTFALLQCSTSSSFQRARTAVMSMSNALMNLKK